MQSFGLGPNNSFVSNYVLAPIERFVGGVVGAAVDDVGARAQTFDLTPIELQRKDQDAPPEFAYPVNWGQMSSSNDANIWKPEASLPEPKQILAIDSATTNLNEHMPEALSVRTFTLGGLGSGGPSFQVAENFGATVTQITTADGKDLLSTKAKEGHYSRGGFYGAGCIGGMPIVAPAGRTVFGKSASVMKHKGESVVEFPFELIGPKGRIPMDKNGVMSHGAVFTSPHWKQSKLESIGTNGENGLRVTYTLNFVDDDVLKLMGPGKVDVVYTLVKGKDGETVFDSDIKVSTEDDKPVYIGALAQHSFFKTDENDTLQSSAPDEVQSKEGRPELPTGKIIEVTKGNDFNKAKKIHDGTDREVVLTGYEKNLDNKTPTAILNRPDQKLKIKVEAGGIIGDTRGFDGFLVCNKAGKDKLMLEPIARYPNIINVHNKSNNKKIEPIIVTKDKPFRAHSRITAMAA